MGNPGLNLVTVFICTYAVVAAENCLKGDYSRLDPQTFYNKYVLGKPGRHDLILNGINNTTVGQKPLITRFIRLIRQQSKESFFKSRVEAMFRTMWLSSLTLGELTNETRCVFTNTLNMSIAVENGIFVEGQEDCICSQGMFLISDAVYKMARKILERHNCSTASVPVLSPPRCYDASVCVDGGRYYKFKLIWEEFLETEDDISKQGFSNTKNYGNELYQIMKDLYKSEDQFERNVAAAISISVIETGWMWKSGNLNNDLGLKVVQSLAIVEGALHRTMKCNCEQLADFIMTKVEDLRLVVDALKTGILHNLDAVAARSHFN